MPRDQFISDNLIDIRDRLRENYQSVNTGRSQETPSPRPSGEIHLDLKAPLAQAPLSSGRSADREFNEFAGALEHDLAAAAAELAFAGQQQKALEEFQELLQKTAEALHTLPSRDSADFFREFDRLRIAYFQGAGAAAPYRKQAAAPAVKSPSLPESPPAASRNILLSVAVLLAAAMVSLTLIFLFA